MTTLPEPMRDRRGFTLIELLVYVVISGFVLTSVYQLVITQSRAFGKQRELSDVHESLRSAAAFLAWEIRQLSAAGGDIYAVQPRSLTVRSTAASGVLCVEHPTLPRFGITALTGDPAASGADSVLVFAAGDPGPQDDAWNVLRVGSQGTPADIGIGDCVWHAAIPDRALALVPASASDTAGVEVGAPIRFFRRVEYALYPHDGRWWLGRKVGASSNYELLTGPLQPADEGGLEFRYYDAAGNTVTDPTAIAVVEIILRAASLAPISGLDGGPQTASLSTKVALRG